MKLTNTLSPEVPETQPESCAPSLTLREQIDQLGAEILASAQRLASDPEHVKVIQKQLF